MPRMTPDEQTDFIAKFELFFEREKVWTGLVLCVLGAYGLALGRYQPALVFALLGLGLIAWGLWNLRQGRATRE